MSVCIQVNRVDLSFGNKPHLAFDALDQGKNREEIQKDLAQVVAVCQVSFDVKIGEILVIMGLSGSGKSSLLRCLNGMNGRGYGMLRGEILLHDNHLKNRVDVSRCSSKRLREIRRTRMAMVFQQFGLMPWRSVFHNVAYPLEIQGIEKKEIKQRVEEKLELVGLTSWKSHYPYELSGGMQQRVGLARAFVTDADILLMDEPFSALDPLHRKRLQDEILKLQEKLKKTIVFVTHDFNEAIRIANRIAVMDAGRILQLDKPEEIVSNPSCERVNEFINVVT